MSTVYCINEKIRRLSTKMKVETKLSLNMSIAVGFVISLCVVFICSIPSEKVFSNGKHVFESSPTLDRSNDSNMLSEVFYNDQDISFTNDHVSNPLI